YSPWSKSIPVLVCHPQPQSDAYGLKVLHFTPKNDSLTLTLANESAKPSPLEVRIPSIMQLPCLDLTPCINISNKYKALTLKCHHSNQSLSCCHCPAPGLTPMEISPIGALCTDSMNTHRDQMGDVLTGEGRHQLSGVYHLQRWFNYSEVHQTCTPPGYLFLCGPRVNQLPHQNNPNAFPFPGSRNLGITIHNVTQPPDTRAIELTLAGVGIALGLVAS
ncbi:hypothetical protein EI555_004098, partial [Monodon monoceros]